MGTSWQATAASVRGSSHVRAGIPNQDAVAVWQGTRDPVVVGVADGHGSPMYPRSDVGSRLAVDVGCRLLFESLRAGSPLEELPARIAAQWREAVADDLELHPLTEAELSGIESAEGPTARAAVESDPFISHGATLLLAGATGDRGALLQIGDGDILCVFGDGSVSRPVPDDDRLVGDQTTSLASEGSERDFRVATMSPATRLVMLATDGYGNSFETPEGFFQVGTDYLELVRERTIEGIRPDLHQWLAEVSEFGAGDDVSVALMVRND